MVELSSIIICYQEFYTEQHWEKLPRCWQEALNLADLREVGHILLNQSEQRYKISQDCFFSSDSFIQGQFDIMQDSSW